MGKHKDGGRACATQQMDFDKPLTARADGKLVGMVKNERNRDLDDGQIHHIDGEWIRVRDDGQPWSTTPHTPDANAVFTPAELDDRIRKIGRRVRKCVRKAKRAQCWGCGKYCRNPSRPDKEGWHTRLSPFYPHSHIIECFCPECFALTGWGDELSQHTKRDGDVSERPEPYPDTLKTVECSRCRRLLMTPSQPRQPWYPEVVAGTVYGRPCCHRCLPFARREAAPPVSRFGAGERS